MARQKNMLFSASSEMRKGFTMPTIKKIKSVLMKKSKTFLVNLIITMMAKKSKSEKIKLLIKIEKGKIVRKVKRRKKAKGKTAKRKTAKKKAKNGRKKKGFAGQVRGSKAEKKAKAKAQRARKRKS